MKIVNKKLNSSTNEIEILRKISHPNIVNIYEIFEDVKKYYIITEFCEGGELFQQITKHGFYTESDAVKIINQILEAVNYLHELNIVHRDIKPENIMLSNNKNDFSLLKLIDFGTAIEIPKGKKLKKFIGTSYYVAPEVIDGCYGKKCDVWSCGIILYILLAGYPPFNGNTNKEIYDAIKNQKLTFSNKEWNNISSDAIDLIRKMLEKNPKKRYNVQECLNHPWCKKFKIMGSKISSNRSNKIKIVEKMADFVQQNKFKQAVLQFITTHFNLKKEEDYLRKYFKDFDKENKGLISKNDFQNQIKYLYGDVISKEISDKIFYNLDLDNSGNISYNEFLTSVLDYKQLLTEDSLKKTFNMFDKNGNGKLSIDEIKNYFGGDEETWKNILKEVDVNGDGEVDFDEFKILMLGFNPNEIVAIKTLGKETTINSIL